MNGAKTMTELMAQLRAAGALVRPGNLDQADAQLRDLLHEYGIPDEAPSLEAFAMGLVSGAQMGDAFSLRIIAALAAMRAQALRLHDEADDGWKP